MTRHTAFVVGAMGVLVFIVGSLYFGVGRDVPVSPQATTPEALESLEWYHELQDGRPVRIALPRTGADTPSFVDITAIPKPNIHSSVVQQETVRLSREIDGITTVLEELNSSPTLDRTLREADLMAALALAEACRAAVGTGDYAVLPSMGNAPAVVPTASVVFGQKVSLPNGASGWTYYVLRDDKYPAIKQSRQFRDEVANAKRLEDMTAFNRLPLEERKTWLEAAALARTKEKEMEPGRFLQWLRVQLPKGVPPAGKVDEVNYLIYDN